jgi:hypothetical protein
MFEVSFAHICGKILSLLLLECRAEGLSCTDP